MGSGPTAALAHGARYANDAQGAVVGFGAMVASVTTRVWSSEAFGRGLLVVIAVTVAASVLLHRTAHPPVVAPLGSVCQAAFAGMVCMAAAPIFPWILLLSFVSVGLTLLAARSDPARNKGAKAMRRRWECDDWARELDAEAGRWWREDDKRWWAKSAELQVGEWPFWQIRLLQAPETRCKVACAFHGRPWGFQCGGADGCPGCVGLLGRRVRICSPPAARKPAAAMLEPYPAAPASD